jgi:hypothetical protein
MNLCTARNISVFRSYENDLFPCNNKSILMSILLLFGIKVCMESNKINLKICLVHVKGESLYRHSLLLNAIHLVVNKICLNQNKQNNSVV